jgi:hypothetical protein
VLSSSPAFATEYDIVRVPPVHTITAGQLSELKELIARASLIIAQPVRPGYRGMGLGTDELIPAAPRACRVIRIPGLYHQGLFPFQALVGVNAKGRRPLGDIPLTGSHHDLRIIACAAQAMDADTAVDWVQSYVPEATALREIADVAAAEVRRRERETDIPVFDLITSSPATHAGSFFTVNHPSRFALRHVSEGVHRAIGIPFDDIGTEELLDPLKTPLEPPALKALGLPLEGRSHWVVDGKDVSMELVVEAQLSFYRQHPEVVAAALRKYVRRFRRLALVRVRPALALLENGLESGPPSRSMTQPAPRVPFG